MILALEILFLVAGLYALFTGKMPSWIVGKGYKAEGNPVRLLGILMVAVLPSVFCGGIVIGIASAQADFDPTWIAIAFEFISVIVAAIIVTLVLRRIRQPDVLIQQTPSSISDQKPE
jgi:hypothetical protein